MAHAFFVDALPILNEAGKIITPASEKKAHLHLIDAIQKSSDKTTLLFVGNMSLVKVKKINSTVVTGGPSQGRTVETPDGRPVNLVYDVDRDAFFNYITELAKKAK